MAMADALSPRGTVRGPAARSAGAKRFHGRLKVDATFCPAEVADLFDTVEWEVRTAAIKGENGEVLFEQTNCEVPSFWTQLATNVVCSKYFYGEVGTPEREYSVRQLIHRVARTIADWGLEDGYFASAEDGERFYRELTWLCLHQHGAFNSPVWFNVGLYHQYGVKGAQVQLALGSPRPRRSCSPRTRTSIRKARPASSRASTTTWKTSWSSPAARPCSSSSARGTGTDLSTLRSHREKLAGGGKPSRPALVHAGLRPDRRGGEERRQDPPRRQDAVAQGLASGHHGIHRVQVEGREEGPRLIEKGGYEANFNGEAYSSIMFQNANLSVRVTDDFMQAVEKNEDWTTHWVTDPKQPGPTYPAREMHGPHGRLRLALRRPRRAVRHDDQPLAHLPEQRPHQRQSNPCSEYMFLDDTACNLASINLMKFRQADGTFDVERFQAACRIFFIAQEILVDHASYPTQRHRREQPPVPAARAGLLEPRQPAHDGRHAVRLATQRRGVCGAITALLHGAANLTSAELAEAVGPFDGYDENREPMLRVMQMHRDAVEEIDPSLPGVSEGRGPRRVGRRARRRRACTASATRRPRCSPRPARSAS